MTEEQSLESLVAALHSSKPEVRGKAADMLRQRGEPGKQLSAEMLLEMLVQDRAQVCDAAVKMLHQMQEYIPIEALLQTLNHDSVEAYLAILRALPGAQDSAQAEASLPPTPVSSLVEALQDADASVRCAAVKALADLGESMPIQPIQALLDDPDKQVRRAAAKALVRIGEPAAIAAIVADVHADHEWKRENAFICLVESTETQMQEISRNLPIALLLTALHDEWWPVGIMAGQLIAALGDEAPLDELLVQLQDTDPQTRWVTLATLALLGERVPMEPLLAALDDEDVSVRREAAAALECFGARVPVEKLLPLIEEEDVRAARVVAKLGRQEGVDALVKALSNLESAWQAAGALAEVGDRAPVEPLVAALGNSQRSVCDAAIEALCKTHPEALPGIAIELAATLRGERVASFLEPLQQGTLISAIAALRSPKPAFLATLDDALDHPYWEIRLRAALALRPFGQDVPESIIQKLRRLLDDPESAGVRKAARSALEDPMPA